MNGSHETEISNPIPALRGGRLEEGQDGRSALAKAAQNLLIYEKKYVKGALRKKKKYSTD